MSRKTAEIMSKNPKLAAQIKAAESEQARRGVQELFMQCHAEAKKAPKYRNQKTERHGMKFDSKLEADVYDALCARYGAANVIRQVSIPVGRYRIRPDFMVITNVVRPLVEAAGFGWLGAIGVFFADAKGIETDAWKAKANHLKDKHGIEIRLIRKAKDI